MVMQVLTATGPSREGGAPALVAWHHTMSGATIGSGSNDPADIPARWKDHRITSQSSCKRQRKNLRVKRNKRTLGNHAQGDRRLEDWRSVCGQP